MAPKDVAKRLDCDVTKIPRTEFDLYGVSDPAKRHRLFSLARDSRKQTWWHHTPVTPCRVLVVPTSPITQPAPRALHTCPTHEALAPQAFDGATDLLLPLECYPPFGVT